jgi:hypothetical protein
MQIKLQIQSPAISNPPIKLELMPVMILLPLLYPYMWDILQVATLNE